MNTPKPRAVVLLHGLPFAEKEAKDRFANLVPLEQECEAAGLKPLRFDWPPDFPGPRLLVSRSRSFSGELAKALDSYFVKEIGEKATDGKMGDWVVIGHSAGGLAFYRWLVDYGEEFAKHFRMPSFAFLFAAPYQCIEGEIPVPDGRKIPVHEKKFKTIEDVPALLCSRLPERLILFIADKDEMFCDDDTMFPKELESKGLVHQNRMPGTTHQGVTLDPLALSMVSSYLHQL